MEDKKDKTNKMNVKSLFYSMIGMYTTIGLLVITDHYIPVRCGKEPFATSREEIRDDLEPIIEDIQSYCDRGLSGSDNKIIGVANFRENEKEWLAARKNVLLRQYGCPNPETLYIECFCDIGNIYGNHVILCENSGSSDWCKSFTKDRLIGEERKKADDISYGRNDWEFENWLKSKGR